MVNKDMNGFPVKKCSAFQFFKKRVRRWIKNPMVSVDKHQSPSLKYTGPSVVHSPHGEPDLEPSLCRTCLGDHAFQRGVLPQEKESCPWETQPRCEVKEPCTHANILTKPDHRTFWTNDDSAFMKQRRMGLNDFIQKIANNSYACKHPEVQSILKISQPQEPELMNANPSPPSTPSLLKSPSPTPSAGPPTASSSQPASKRPPRPSWASPTRLPWTLSSEPSEGGF
uniref:Serum/glucocorticoid regulated kinase 1 n=1 Tax=Myotis myotis TaxID=51298 RepID=A0A7J7WX90_MYOMY|nr:serum/glucocorticoid regulated kinase 1 [Myotis myotis]